MISFWSISFYVCHGAYITQRAHTHKHIYVIDSCSFSHTHTYIHKRAHTSVDHLKCVSFFLFLSYSIMQINVNKLESKFYLCTLPSLFSSPTHFFFTDSPKTPRKKWENSSSKISHTVQFWTIVKIPHRLSTQRMIQKIQKKRKTHKPTTTVTAENFSRYIIVILLTFIVLCCCCSKKKWWTQWKIKTI